MTNVGEVDLDASREARDAMTSSSFWKPQSGEGNRWKDNFIRVLPPHKNMEGKFHFAIPLHFDVGPSRAIVPCPRRAYGGACPICIEGYNLRGKGMEDEGNALLPTFYGYLNVVPLDDDGTPSGQRPRVRVYSAAGTVIEEILQIMETKYADLLSLETGRNVNIRKRGSGKKGTRYQVGAAAEPSAFDYPDLVEDLIDLGKVTPFLDPAKIQALLTAPAHADPFGSQDPEQPKLAEPVGEPKGAMAFAPPPEDGEDEAPAAEEAPAEAPSSDQNEVSREHLRRELASRSEQSGDPN